MNKLSIPTAVVSPIAIRDTIEESEYELSLKELESKRDEIYEILKQKKDQYLDYFENEEEMIKVLTEIKNDPTSNLNSSKPFVRKYAEIIIKLNKINYNIKKTEEIIKNIDLTPGELSVILNEKLIQQEEKLNQQEEKLLKLVDKEKNNLYEKYHNIEEKLNFIQNQFDSFSKNILYMCQSPKLQEEIIINAILTKNKYMFDFIIDNDINNTLNGELSILPLSVFMNDEYMVDKLIKKGIRFNGPISIINQLYNTITHPNPNYNLNNLIEEIKKSSYEKGEYKLVDIDNTILTDLLKTWLISKQNMFRVKEHNFKFFNYLLETNMHYEDIIIRDRSKGITKEIYHNSHLLLFDIKMNLLNFASFFGNFEIVKMIFKIIKNEVIHPTGCVKYKINTESYAFLIPKTESGDNIVDLISSKYKNIYRYDND
jgi:hypothetical protein